MLRGAELSDRDFTVLRAGILRDALAVVDTVDIHLTATIGAVHQAREGSGFAPAVGITFDASPYLLYKVIGLLVDYGFVGVLENRPLVLRDVVAFLVLEVLAGLEIAGMPQILPLFQNVNDGGGTPAVHVLKCLVFVHALVVLRKVCCRNEYLFL